MGIKKGRPRFSGVALAESDVPRLIEQSSVAFMKTLDARFDPRLARRGSFVRKGEVDDAARALDPALLAALAEEEERVLGGSAHSTANVRMRAPAVSAT